MAATESGKHKKSIQYHEMPANTVLYYHYQGNIDFNTVNIHCTVGMYFLLLTGNRDDIEMA